MQGVINMVIIELSTYGFTFKDLSLEPFMLLMFEALCSVDVLAGLSAMPEFVLNNQISLGATRPAASGAIRHSPGSAGCGVRGRDPFRMLNKKRQSSSQLLI